MNHDPNQIKPDNDNDEVEPYLGIIKFGDLDVSFPMVIEELHETADTEFYEMFGRDFHVEIDIDAKAKQLEIISQTTNEVWRINIPSTFEIVDSAVPITNAILRLHINSNNYNSPLICQMDDTRKRGATCLIMETEGRMALSQEAAEIFFIAICSLHRQSLPLEAKRSLQLVQNHP